MPKNKKKYVNVVYSTNPDFQYQSNKIQDQETLEPKFQKLYVSLDRKNRGGKEATIVEGFTGTNDDLKDLGKKLKSKFGVGGSVKENIIVIQGNLKEKVHSVLLQYGYLQTKMKGG